MKYRQDTEDKWIRPVMHGYKMACCDCGLVHRLNFRVIPWGRGHKIELQAFRSNRSTAGVRRGMGYHKLKKGKRRYYALDQRGAARKSAPLPDNT